MVLQNIKKLESEIEQKAIKLAKRKFDCEQLKLYEPFWPDRMILCNGKILFVEFKRPNGRLSPGQKIQFEQIRRLGFKVSIVYSVEDYLRLLDSHFKKE